MHNFNHIKLESLNFDLEAENSESGRVYKTPSGGKYPSITTVLSEYNKKAIMEWRERVGAEQANKISAKASGRGTRLHNICEKYLLNEVNDMMITTLMPDVKEMFLSLRPILTANVNNIYGIEQSLYSDELKIAGRCDCIAEWDGTISIIDWKTSSKKKEKDWIENYFMQAAGYAEMFEERTGMAINQIVVVIAVESDFPQIFVEEKNKYIDNLKNYIERYQR